VAVAVGEVVVVGVVVVVVRVVAVMAGGFLLRRAGAPC